MKTFICILKRDAQILTEHSELIVKDIQLLRSDLIKCRKLECYNGCEYKAIMKATVEQALKEIYTEWKIEI